MKGFLLALVSVAACSCALAAIVALVEAEGRTPGPPDSAYWLVIAIGIVVGAINVVARSWAARDE